MSAFEVYQWLVTIGCLKLPLVAGLNWALARRDRLAARRLMVEAGDDTPLISVCIPARNEAHNIGPCVRSLARQRYPNFEVLVLDDQSEDATLRAAQRAAAGHPHVRVLSGQPLPPGWIGKSWACHQLAAQARGQWLLFTDADTVFSPNALPQILATARATRAELLSGTPRLTVRGWAERLSVPLLTLGGATAFLYGLMRLRQPWFYAAASGALIFVHRPLYDRMGGHGALAGDIVEDVGMARRAKRLGGRVVMTEAAGWLRCRMYRSAGEVWEGFTKNFHSVFPGPLTWLVMLMLLVFYVGPWLSFIFGPGGVSGTWLPLAQLVLTLGTRAVVDRRLGTPDLAGWLLTPAAAVYIILIAARSQSRALLRHPTPWRGRTYPLWQQSPAAKKANKPCNNRPASDNQP